MNTTTTLVLLVGVGYLLTQPRRMAPPPSYAPTYPATTPSYPSPPPAPAPAQFDWGGLFSGLGQATGNIITAATQPNAGYTSQRAYGGDPYAMDVGDGGWSDPFAD